LSILHSLAQFTKKRYPFSLLARAVDLHFTQLESISRHVEEVAKVREEVALLRINTGQLEKLPAWKSEIAHRLGSIEGSVRAVTRVPSIAEGLPESLHRTTVVVTPNEVNRCHGTGILVKRLLGDVPAVVSIRSTDTYTGGQEFGCSQHKLPTMGLSRAQIFGYVSRLLHDAQVERVVCVPFFPDELLVALAVKEIFGVPLCLYIMDDQNLCGQSIPDDLLAEVVAKANLRLAISSEMQYAYQNKYQERFWLLPPLVPTGLIRQAAGPEDANRAILIGNIWSQPWLDALRETVRGSGTQVDWYCNQRSSGALTFNEDELRRDGIFLHESKPEAELAPEIQRCGFAIVPTTTGEEGDTAEPIARYSLPSRVPFILATCQTPIMVLGQPETCVARFTVRFGIGECCPYEREPFIAAARRMRDPGTQQRMRGNAWRIASAFADEGMHDWLLRSINERRPVDQRFEELAPLLPGTFAHYCETPCPDDVITGLVPVYQSLRRLKRLGLAPDFVVDLGASTGIWSYTVAKLFPQARYILVDALASRYRESRIEIPAEAVWVESAVANEEGRLRIQVSEDLYNSSLVHVGDVSSVTETVEVPVTTLDALATEHGLSGRGLVKIDVQYVEHLVLQGATQMLRDHTDVVAIELTLERVNQESRTFPEVIAMMDDLGFSYWDDAGEWRERSSGALEQKDVVFVRKGLFRTPFGT
jgi:FkbM family methyltransferase